MVKKLSKYGNSLALIIDKPILELLNIHEDTPLKISTDGSIILIAPADKEEVEQSKRKVSDRKEVQKAFDKVTKKYADVLKKLADS